MFSKHFYDRVQSITCAADCICGYRGRLSRSASGFSLWLLRSADRNFALNLATTLDV